MKKFVQALSSLRLAVGLLVYLAIAGIFGTLLRPEAAGSSRSWLPDRSTVGMALVVLPLLLFLANLSTCAARRFLRQLHAEGRKRFGPDVLHLGLVLLVVGGLWSWSGRVERVATLEPGEGAALPDGSTLVVRDLRFEAYDDGRPRDWVSVVDLARDGTTLVEAYELRVNSPLRHAGLTFFQASFIDEWVLTLRDAAGTELGLRAGDTLTLGPSSWTFLGIADPGSSEPGRAAVRTSGPEAGMRTLNVTIGERVEGLEVAGLRRIRATGIGAVSDPGYPLVLAALILVAIGTAWTFLGKLKEAA